jgi:iron(III) transport system substrate-binding protein
LIEARARGKIAFYSARAEHFGELARAFEAKYPGIAARVERSGAERIFQRIGQEQDSRINAVDLVCTTDPAHFIFWKRKDWIAPYVTEDMAKNLPREQINPDGTSATVCAWFSVIGYNTELVKPEGRRVMLVPIYRSKMEGQDRQGSSGL